MSEWIEGICNRNLYTKKKKEEEIKENHMNLIKLTFYINYRLKE